MPIKSQEIRTEGFQLAEFLPHKLAVVADHISRVFAENMNELHNLTIPEWRVLVIVAGSAPVSPSTVGQRAAMDKVKVSRATQGLIARGLLRQNQDPRDGRGRLLRLTRKGTNLYGASLPVAETLSANVFDDLSLSDTVALSRLLTKIMTRIEITDQTGGAAGI